MLETTLSSLRSAVLEKDPKKLLLPELKGLEMITIE